MKRRDKKPCCAPSLSLSLLLATTSTSCVYPAEDRLCLSRSLVRSLACLYKYSRAKEKRLRGERSIERKERESVCIDEV